MRIERPRWLIRRPKEEPSWLINIRTSRQYLGHDVLKLMGSEGPEEEEMVHMVAIRVGNLSRNIRDAYAIGKIRGGRFFPGRLPIEQDLPQKTFYDTRNDTVVQTTQLVKGMPDLEEKIPAEVWVRDDDLRGKIIAKLTDLLPPEVRARTL